MNLKPTLLAAALAATAILAAPAGHAATSATATGITTFKVILQPVVVLDYYKEIDLTVNAAALQTLAGTSTNPTTTKAVTATASGSALTANAALVAGGSDLSNVALTLNNAWAVRSINTPTSGSTTVTIGLGSASGTSDTLTGVTDTASTIALSNPGTTTTIPAGGTGFANAVNGNVTMTMNLGNAKSADTYASSTGKDIYITATAT
ncbi:MAG: hypothetical protein ACREPY_16080 [Rhodanobacteraceae bacterium]